MSRTCWIPWAASLWAIAAVACACGPVVQSPPPAAASEQAEQAEQAEPTKPQPELTIAIDHRPKLAQRIAAAGYQGVQVILVPATHTLIVSEPAFAERRFIPASTFKIPNALIALETGVADSPEFTLEWDGEDRGGASWNRDHDMRSAFEQSAVWYFQELARRIGEQRMAKWLTAANYGNADISGGIDAFWLNGGLRISPREQVELLERLDAGTSPFAPTTVATFLDEVMVYSRREGAWAGVRTGSVRAKTGWAKSKDFEDPATAGFDGNLGWFVGSVVQANGRRIYFATLLLAPEPTPERFADDRVELTAASLRELGYLE